MPFSILALQTGGGAEFLRRFDQATEEGLIAHCFSHPRCPEDNAFVERMIQSEGHELWAFREGYTVEELNQILDGRDLLYDHARPHQGLGRLAPMEFPAQWMEESEPWG